MIYKVFQYFFLTIILLGCEPKSKKEKIPPSQFQEKVGKETLELIVNPAAVSVAGIIKTQGGFVFDKNWKTLSVGEIEQFKKLLLNDNGYILNKQKKCLFIPEIGLRIDGKKELVILVSPLCKQIKIDDSKRAVVLDYDPMAEEFTSFAKSLLGENHEK